MVYSDEDGRFYLDIDMNCNKTKEPISLHAASPINDPEGEPDYRVTEPVEVLNPPTDKEILEAQYEFEYMMLSKNISTAYAYFYSPSDCRYKDKTIDIKRVVSKMREFWERIPSAIKPVWCTEHSIQKYENLVKEL